MIRGSRVAAIVVLSIASSSMASLIPTAQVRTVSARGFTSPSSAAPGFGAWSASADSDISSSNLGWGFATQTSDINSLHLTATASIQVSRGLNAFSGNARSQFYCEFDVDSILDYTLNGDWTARHSIFVNTAPQQAFMKFERLSPTPEVFYFSQFWIDYADPNLPVVHDSANVAMNGILTPGHYRIETVLDRTEGFGGSSSSGTFNVDLRVPGPASALAFGGAFFARRRRR